MQDLGLQAEGTVGNTLYRSVFHLCLFLKYLVIISRASDVSVVYVSRSERWFFLYFLRFLVSLIKILHYNNYNYGFDCFSAGMTLCGFGYLVVL